jgi:hypothetical protein
MSALSFLNTLGSAGAAAGENRTANQDRQFQGQLAAQQLAMRLATMRNQAAVQAALEKYRIDSLNQRATLEGRPDWTPGRNYKDADGQWYTEMIDRHSGKLMKVPSGAPESNVNIADRDADTAKRQKDLQELKGQQAQDLAAARAKYAMGLAKFKAAHPTARSGAASLGAVPLAAGRWYRALGGSQIDEKIKTYESMLKQMELTSLGGPEQLYQNQLYVRTQQQLKDLYAQSDKLMSQAMSKVGGGANTAPAPATNTGGPIRVKPEDIPAAQ